MADLQTGLRGSAQTWRSTPPTPAVPEALLPPRSGSLASGCGPGGSATCSASGGRKSSSQPHGILIADCPWLIGATWEPSPRGSCVLGVP